jgi:hypothetical protein
MKRRKSESSLPASMVILPLLPPANPAPRPGGNRTAPSGRWQRTIAARAVHHTLYPHSSGARQKPSFFVLTNTCLWYARRLGLVALTG